MFFVVRRASPIQYVNMLHVHDMLYSVYSGLRSDPGWDPMQWAGPKIFRTSVRCQVWPDAVGGAQVIPGFGPMSGGAQYVLFVLLWYAVVWGSSLSCVLSVSNFGFRYFRK